MAGALTLHFTKSKTSREDQSPTPAKSARPLKIAEHRPYQVYSRHQLKSLAPAKHFKTPSQAYLQAKGLVESHQEKTAAERHEALLHVLALLYRIQAEDPAWETELISKRIEQTTIALLELQEN